MCCRIQAIPRRQDTKKREPSIVHRKPGSLHPNLLTKDVDGNTDKHEPAYNTRANVEGAFIASLVDE